MSDNDHSNDNLNSLKKDDIERDVLGSIFLDPALFDTAYDKGIKPDFFDNDKNKNIFKLMQSMKARFMKIESFALIRYAQSYKKLEECGGIPYINELEHEVPTSSNFDYYSDILIALCQKSKFLEAKKKIDQETQRAEAGVITSKELQEVIQKVSDDLKDLANNVFSKSKEDYDKDNAFSHVFNLLQDVETGNFDKTIPTGFTGLDTALEGGLTPKLFIIGAISSMGKTTFMLQIADQLAKAGNGVIFFSMEMSAKELASKSFSRLSNIKDPLNSLSAVDICTGKKGAGLTEAEKDNLRMCAGEYEKYAKNFRYEIGIKKPSEIRRCINSYIHFTGKKPIVFIDYLQLIAPEDSRLIDKQAIDSNLTALKGLSVEFNIPVIVISSLNRDSYDAEVSMSSFKESGKIEYSADILLALQPLGMSYYKDIDNSDILRHNEKVASEGNEYPIELKVLKQRFGSKPKVTFFYRPRYDRFRDTDEIREVLLEKQAKVIKDFLKQKNDNSDPDSSDSDDNKKVYYRSKR